MDRTPLRTFLEIPYDKLEEMNLEAKQQRLDRVPADKTREVREKYLRDEKRIKAVTVCFTDLEGRFHMLDYDKKFLLGSSDNLTFDGSSVRGFSQQAESDLRLAVDWTSFYWLPADVFGPGKVLVFGVVEERDGTPYHADMRIQLKAFTERLFARRRHDRARVERDRGLPLQGARRRAAVPRQPPVRVPVHGRLLPLAARRRAAAVHRHVGRGAAGARASPTRRTIPRWRRRSSR